MWTSLATKTINLQPFFRLSISSPLTTVAEQILIEARNAISPELSRRTNHPPPLPLSHGHELFPLVAIVARHFRARQSPTIAISGPGADALVYSLLAALVADGPFVVLVVDPWHHFDATLVPMRDQDLEHVHVLRPPVPLGVGDGLDGDDDDGGWDVVEKTAQAREWLAYGTHASRHREFWGTVLFGGAAGRMSVHGRAGGGGGGGVCADVVTGRKGWLRVERPRLDGFPVGTSAEEALARREARQSAADAVGWRAVCAWGEFSICP